MVNEDIITALRNAVEHGESLETAIRIMVNSGYNPQEIHEASRFVGGREINIEPEEHLIMPSQKENLFSKLNFFKKMKSSKKYQNKPIKQQTNLYQTKIQKQIPGQLTSQSQFQNQSQNQIQIQDQYKSSQQPNDFYNNSTFTEPKFSPESSSVGSSQSLSRELKKINPPKHNNKREIYLLIILLVLIGVLVITIIYRNQILGFFS